MLSEKCFGKNENKCEENENENFYGRKKITHVR